MMPLHPTNHHIQRLATAEQVGIRLQQAFLQTELLLRNGRRGNSYERGNLRIAETQADEQTELLVGRRQRGETLQQAGGETAIHTAACRSGRLPARPFRARCCGGRSRSH